MGAGIRFVLWGIQLEKQLQPLHSKGRGEKEPLIPERGNNSPTASKLAVTGRAQGFNSHLATLKGETALRRDRALLGTEELSPTTRSLPGGHDVTRCDNARSPVCLSVCPLVREEGSKGRRWEQHPHRVSCGRRGREKSRCQEEKGSLSVSSTARERWIYHGFPSFLCFIWQFIILSAGTVQLPWHTPSLANLWGSHVQDLGKMPTWTT